MNVTILAVITYFINRSGMIGTVPESSRARANREYVLRNPVGITSDRILDLAAYSAAASQSSQDSVVDNIFAVSESTLERSTRCWKQKQSQTDKDGHIIDTMDVEKNLSIGTGGRIQVLFDLDLDM
jgi:hypothetical protein